MPLLELDCVELTVDLPDEGLRAGAEGTIVHVFTDPDTAYLVEFLDEDGNQVACCTLLPEQLKLTWRRD